MKHLVLLFSVFILLVPYVHANKEYTFKSTGKIDRHTFSSEGRFVGKCGAENEYYEYKRKGVSYLEVCNEPDETHYGDGETVEQRAQNYYKHISKARKNFPDKKIVLGGLSGYNYEFIKTFLSLKDSCLTFDVFNYHPYHFGVAPDVIDTKKDAWHTVEQWTGFISELLKDAGCDKKDLWVTEIGYSRVGKDAEKPVSDDEQLSYLIQEEIILVSLGASKIAMTGDPKFALSSENLKKKRKFEKLLSSAKFISYTQGGDAYCPRSSQCFYDESVYRKDTGKSVYGLRHSPKEQKVRQVYNFKKGRQRIKVYWNRGEAEVNVRIGRLKTGLVNENASFYKRLNKVSARKEALRKRLKKLREKRRKARKYITK